MEESSKALQDTLAELRDTIQRIQRRNEKIGEQNTKAVLIEPLLSALGWNPLDLNEVVREYRYKPQDNPVDYALFILNSPRLFVEAKDLSANLDDHKWISQTVSYATVAGVEWCVLTNGDEYRFYNAHAPVDVDKKLFRTVRISDPAQEESTVDTLDLLSKDKMGENLIAALWKADFVDRKIGLTLEKLVSPDNKRLISWIRKLQPELRSSDIRESLKRADVHVEFPTITPSTLLEKSPIGRAETRKGRSPKMLGVEVSDLIEAGYVKPPIQLFKEYRGHHLKATVQPDGSVVFSGQSYDSLSTAAGMARNSVIGPPTDGRKFYSTNGWTFWKYRDQETGEPKEIDDLRQAYLKQHPKRA